MPAWQPGLMGPQQAYKQWAEQAAAAALAALENTTQARSQAGTCLFDEVRSAAAECSAAAHAAADQKQLLPQQQADAVVATARLAAAGFEVARLEQLLQLAGVSLDG
uniref:Uncharacterized protein n=1 Tax=Tetradesmus obliquus TaxID=3088 RepID=A0A383W3E7_TETOB|eukprot:jgi/Sobl393_1/17288/SZX72177.1